MAVMATMERMADMEDTEGMVDTVDMADTTTTATTQALLPRLPLLQLDLPLPLRPLLTHPGSIIVVSADASPSLDVSTTFPVSVVIRCFRPLSLCPYPQSTHVLHTPYTHSLPSLHPLRLTHELLLQAGAISKRPRLFAYLRSLGLLPAAPNSRWFLPPMHSLRYTLFFFSWPWHEEDPQQMVHKLIRRSLERLDVRIPSASSSSVVT